MNELCFYRRLIPLFFRPVGVDAVFQRHPINPKMSGKRGNNKWFALVSNVHIARYVCLLLRVAHLQLSLKYPLELSIRSRLVLFGFSPISARNASNVCHSLDTVIPLPPY